MPYPANKPLPSGVYRWSMILAGPGPNGREVRFPCEGAYRVGAGDTVTALEIHEHVRAKCATELGIPQHAANTFNFNLHT
ncbi:hypothetical protein ABZ915_17655 [Streptomyces sp. NPDC046915]|uniref:hypothetical protein n=1 Tax=Streptomyces sp. NPDC046915 TaxID=3155257 RepID=UPI0033D9F9F5